MNENFVKGICEEMCPESEIKMRTNEHLLHFYEIKQGANKQPYKVVKAFSRSAAGSQTPRKTELRTFRSLKKTVHYLLKEILLDKRKSFNFIYDFIFDRLRCIRQEIVIQNLNLTETIELLEPIILFLAYSSYKLCEESIDNFDPKICNQHLQECLKKTLSCYDQLDLLKTERKIQQQRNRIFIESLYQLLNLGTVEALERSINLAKEIRFKEELLLSERISLEYLKGNYYRSLRLIIKLPHILCAIASLKINTLRMKIFNSFVHAYNSKQLMVPTEFMRKILLISSNEILFNDCQIYNIEVVSHSQIRFDRNKFNTNNLIVKTRHEKFVDEKLKSIYLPEILLLKKIN